MKSSQAAVGGLLVLGLLPVVGRFLPATLSWGFGHEAFLSPGIWVASIAGWLLLFAPPVRRGATRFLYDKLGGWLFGRSVWPAFVCALVAFLIFRLLATPTHLLGDGVLIGELVAREAEFRAHDAMDYLLHRLIIQWAGKAGSDPASFSLYLWSSCIAGFAGVLTAILLLRRSSLPRATKVMAFSLWILSAATLIFCGYVESYSYLAVAMLGFLWSGVLTERGEVSPLVPGIFFGGALFFHTLGIVAAPALLWLAFRIYRQGAMGPAGAKGWAGPRDRGRRIVLLLAPAIALPLAAVIFHVMAGFDGEWFRREFVESKNQRQILIHLTGPDGILSLKYLKDNLNWLVLVIPIAGWLFAARARMLRARLKEPGIAFLLIHVAAFALVSLVMDRKLGFARDWDILTPQIAGIVWLAAVLWQPESVDPRDEKILPPVRAAAPWVALLLLCPWIAVNVSRVPSLAHFEAIKADFATFPRAYATEELAKYYRDHGDWSRALPLYEECVRIYPKNMRTRVLLGSTYNAVGRFDDAIAQYDEALRIDPTAWLAISMEARIWLMRKDYPRALDFYRRLTALQGGNPDAWAGRGYCALRTKEYSDARDSFLKASGLKIDPQLYYYAGLSCTYLGQWDLAVENMDRALRAGAKDPLTIFAAAATIEAHMSAGGSVNRDELVRARNLAMRAAAAAPGDSTYSTYLQHLDGVLAGKEKPANWLHP